MLTAWSITEVIRYSYFAINLSSGGSVPKLWLWLRYNTFFVLYPLGISSECALVWKAAVGPAGEYTGVKEALFVILAVYVPGMWVFFFSFFLLFSSFFSSFFSLSIPSFFFFSFLRLLFTVHMLRLI
jgi:hypothetical protein